MVSSRPAYLYLHCFQKRINQDSAGQRLYWNKSVDYFLICVKCNIYTLICIYLYESCLKDAFDSLIDISGFSCIRVKSGKLNFYVPSIIIEGVQQSI